MNIRKWMTHPVHGVKPHDSIHHARALMERHRINQLPVIVEGQVVGIITDRDLRDAFPSVFEADLFMRRKPGVSASDPRLVSVEMVMTANVTTIDASASIAEAARIMRRRRIGALPVLEGGRPIGIITRSDILEWCVSLAAAEDRRAVRLFPQGTAARAAASDARPRRRHPA